MTVTSLGYSLEPPDLPDHLRDCATEDGRWYECVSISYWGGRNHICGELFRAQDGDGAPNRCPACGYMARRVEGICTCDEIRPCRGCGELELCRCP